jgi:hypothetical protein
VGIGLQRLMGPTRMDSVSAAAPRPAVAAPPPPPAVVDHGQYTLLGHQSPATSVYIEANAGYSTMAQPQYTPMKTLAPHSDYVVGRSPVVGIGQHHLYVGSKSAPSSDWGLQEVDTANLYASIATTAARGPAPSVAAGDRVALLHVSFPLAGCSDRARGHRRSHLRHPGGPGFRPGGEQLGVLPPGRPHRWLALPPSHFPPSFCSRVLWLQHQRVIQVTSLPRSDLEQLFAALRAPGGGVQTLWYAQHTLRCSRIPIARSWLSGSHTRS